MTKNAVILLSGGMDSTTILAYAKEQGYDCYCISFDYGQRHRYELTASALIAKKYHATEHFIFKLGIGEFGGSAQTDASIAIPTSKVGTEIPSTYTPARNITFLSVALGYAEVRKANDIFIGVSAVDYSNYPDCRPEFISSFEKTANLATKAGVESGLIKIHTPLINLSKAETILMGLKLGVDYLDTVTCYQMTDTGLACAECHACQLRMKGFEEAGVQDATRYVYD
jgi:7-cyano-7-deazaguanine synthase